MGKPSKKFWDQRSRKLNKKHRKKKKRIKYSSKGKKRNESFRQKPDVVFELPENFSFITNLSKTASFVEKTMNKFKRSMPESLFLFDAKNVENATTDAIMYLIALMRNYKETKIKKYNFFGNYPENENAKNVFLESGFLKFVKSTTHKLPENTSKMEILSGNNTDANSAGRMCSFVANKLELKKASINKLYEVIIEMMSNVYYHAYNDNETNMVPEWYMYAEHKEGKVKFLFLDTGLGIGNTVQKHSLYEKVANRIGFGSESRFIKSALNGDFRTQTQKPNHGKGLPFIKEFASSNNIDEFNIISGKGHCMISDSGNIEIDDLQNNVFGTIYSFWISKEEQI